MKRMLIVLVALVCVGCQKSRDATPSLHIEGEVVHPQIAWYQVQRDGSWVKEGAMIAFYENGAVQSIQNIENNVLNGPAWEYLPNGKPASAGVYTHGKPTGIWRIWASNGTFHDKDLGK